MQQPIHIQAVLSFEIGNVKASHVRKIYFTFSTKMLTFEKKFLQQFDHSSLYSFIYRNIDSIITVCLRLTCKGHTDKETFK